MTQSDLGRTIETIGGAVKRLRGKKRSLYRLTALGATKVDDGELTGLKWDVASYLDEHSPSSKTEISTGIPLHLSKVQTTLNWLIGSGYVSRVVPND